MTRLMSFISLCLFLSVGRGGCYAFLYPLGQLLEHFVTFCPVLVCILSKLIVLVLMNELMMMMMTMITLY